jgi:hypothetical protein
MKKVILAVAVLLTPLMGSASIPPDVLNGRSTFPSRGDVASPWSALLQKLQTYGAFRDESPLPSTIGIKDIQGPEDGAHTADYFNAWGSNNGDGFAVEYLTMISEDWKIENGRWRCDQWLFRFDTEGNVIAAARGYVIETLNWEVVDNKRDPVDPNQPEAAAKLQELLSHWRAYK